MKRIFAICCVCLLALVLCGAARAEEGKVLTLSRTEATLTSGQTITLTGRVSGPGPKVRVRYSWNSSDRSVARVNNGKVKAVGPGDAVITCRAKLSDGRVLTAEAAVHVAAKIQSVRAKQRKMSMTAGQIRTVELSIKPADLTNRHLSWASSDPDVAAVDGNGAVTALRAGSAAITGSAGDGSGKSVKISVTVLGGSLPSSLRVLTTELRETGNEEQASYSLGFLNKTSSVVTKLYYLFYCYDTDGNPRFFRGGETEKLSGCWFAVEPDGGQLAPGKSDRAEIPLALTGEDGWMAGMRIALYMFELDSGELIQVPDADLYWYDSALQGYLPREAAVPAVYQLPARKLQDKAEAYDLGIRAADVYTFCMTEYDTPEPGLRVTEVAEGSPAEKAGILPGDILCGADELSWTREPQFLVYACDRLADGKAVVFRLVRGGEEKDLTVSP